MLLTVDFDRCEGHGLCVVSAPEIFSFDDRGALQVVAQPGAEHLPAVEDGVRMCPALAIRLTDSSLDGDAVRR